LATIESARAWKIAALPGFSTDRKPSLPTTTMSLASP